MSALADIRVLLVEPQSGMRASIHNMLTLCGITKIEHAISAGTALGAIQSRTLDLILCEYDLGIGQDGQQLLEDVRHHKLIPLSTLFFMVTAERGYEKVVSAAELAPNDYLLKPFTASNLLLRVNRALEKRAAFLPIYELIETGDLINALAACNRAEEMHSRYAVDFMRLRAELHVMLGEANQAELLYKHVVDSNGVDWARLGVAKSMYLQGRHQEAGQALQALVLHNTLFMDAYDWLAKNHEASGQLPSAKDVLSTAVGISPHSVRRLRKLGQIALETGDLDSAEKSFKKVVSKVRFSDFRDPEDHVMLVHALVQKGDSAQARSVVRELEKTMPKQIKMAVCKAISTAYIHGKNNDPRVTEELAAAVMGSRENIGLSTRMKLGLAKSCLENNLDEQASEVILDVMRNSTNHVDMERAVTIFEQAGRGELGQKLVKQSRQEVMDMVAAGVQKAKQGDYAGSVELMSIAAKQMPDNPQVIMNAALAYLKCLEHTGWQQNLGDKARSLIDAARLLDPTNTRIHAMRALYDELQVKYGIQRSFI